MTVVSLEPDLNLTDVGRQLANYSAADAPEAALLNISRALLARLHQHIGQEGDYINEIELLTTENLDLVDQIERLASTPNTQARPS